MTIKKGDIGEKVKQIQEALQITPDGIFGNMTEQSVKEFQSEEGLEVDGMVGPITWGALGIDNPPKPKYTREQIKSAVESKGYTWFNDDENKGKLCRINKGNFSILPLDKRRDNKLKKILK